jgi:hypothetical protein
MLRTVCGDNAITDLLQYLQSLTVVNLDVWSILSSLYGDSASSFNEPA